MIFHTLHVELKYRSVYVCTCGFKQVGSTARAEFAAETTEELKAKADKLSQRSVHMPIGWSFNGAFKCSKCTGAAT